jgi:ABC-type glycerol-3-phosphate transport system permease component
MFRQGWLKLRRKERRLMRVVVAAHVLAAGVLIIASVLVVRFVGLLPSWLGVIVGLLLFALTLLLAKADDSDEEAP